MEYPEFSQELKNIIEPLLEKEGILLVELKFSRGRNRSLVKLLVDRVGGGISVGDCAQLNRKIGELFEGKNVIQGDYLLEVSSPGLDRPLTSRNDFLCSILKKAKFFLNEVINGKIEIDGIITEVTDQAVLVDTKQGIIEVPLIKIIKAKQIIK